MPSPDLHPTSLIRTLSTLFFAFLGMVLLYACSDSSTLSNNSAVSAEMSQSGGYTQLEEVNADDGEIVIPYKKFQLDNGLTLIIHEDHSDPLIHVDVTYHVGSAREDFQRSGFAHFFEHMMFQGSEHVGDDEHFKIVTESGGTMNGTTNNDRTNYFQTVPSNQLETMLWLESDRMGFLLNAVTEEKFENQRATVKNERGQNVDNAPYGRWSEVMSSALYPPEHPYSWPVIGYTEDLDAATLDDLKGFFLRWYGPNNATLTIGGNVVEHEVLDLVVKYFGEIPPGPEVLPDSQPTPVLDADRYVSYVDNAIRFPALLFTYPTVALDHPDRVPLEALNDMISVGRKSYFYKQFVLTQKAIQASGFNSNQELGGTLTFFVLPFPGTPLSDFEAEMRDVFANFNADSISDDDIQIYKATQEAALIASLSSVRGKVSQLAYYQTFLADPNNIQSELEAIRSLTKEDVLRVFNTYIKDKPAVIESVVPSNDPEGQAKPDNFDIPERISLVDTTGDPLELRNVNSSFDRSVKPTPGANPLVVMPDYWEGTLGNGIEIIGASHSEVPLVSMRLVFDGGHLIDPEGKEGLASLTAAMKNEGTENFTAEEFEKELDKLGSSIGVGGGNETMSISMSSLERNFDATLALLEERLFRSEFTEMDLARLRQQQIESLEANKQEPSAIASDVYRKLIYNEDHTFAIPASGSIESLQTIILDDVEDFRGKNLVSQPLRVVVVGNFSQQEVMDKLGFLLELPNEDVTLPAQPDSPTFDTTTIFLVDKPDAPQSEIRIGYMSDLTYDPTGEYFERYLMNYVLGGAFSSRINLNLREDKGYTYGARSGFSATRIPGPFTASAGVRADSTADSIVQFVNEITGYRENGITPEELQFTKDAIGQSEALDYETPGQKASLLNQIITYNLESDFVREQQNIINNLTIDRVNALAQEYLPIENMAIVVVGDKAVIEESLQTLGYPIVELDEEGNPVN